MSVEKEMEKNHQAYLVHEADLIPEHFGKTALFHDGELIELYVDPDDAYEAGCQRFGLGRFSLETVGAKPISLGLFAINLQG